MTDQGLSINRVFFYKKKGILVPPSEEFSICVNTNDKYEAVLQVKPKTSEFGSLRC